MSDEEEKIQSEPDDDHEDEHINETIKPSDEFDVNTRIGNMQEVFQKSLQEMEQKFLAMFNAIKPTNDQVIDIPPSFPLAQVQVKNTKTAMLPFSSMSPSKDIQSYQQPPHPQSSLQPSLPNVHQSLPLTLNNPNPPPTQIQSSSKVQPYQSLTSYHAQSSIQPSLPIVHESPPISLNQPLPTQIQSSSQPHQSQLPYHSQFSMPQFSLSESSDFQTPFSYKPQAHQLQLHHPEPETQHHQTELRRHLHELPKFGGLPEEWPAFINLYRETTRTYGYTNLENQMRLQKCLYGEAKQVVEALLIYPNNVADVISELKNSFGRDEILIRSQLAKLKMISPITEGKVIDIVPLAVKVKGLAIFLETSNATQHISNPSLLEELCSKLPFRMRLEWTRTKIHIKPHATLHHFSKFLDEEANVIKATTYCTSSSPQSLIETKKNFVMHINTNNSQRASCILCSQDHLLAVCDRFAEMSVDERWKEVKALKLCFSCLRRGHNTFTCRTKFICNIGGCQRKHHKLLHNNFNFSPPESNMDIVSQPLCTLHRPSDVENTELFFKIIPVTLSGAAGSSVHTYAYLDDGAMPSLIDENVAKQLGLQGKSGNIKLQWFGNQTIDLPTTFVEFEIQGVGKKYKVNNFCTIKNLDLPTQSLNFNKLISNNSCQSAELKELPIYDYFNVKPTILVGMSNAYLGVESNRFELGSKGPFIAETRLGWVVYGPTHVQNDHLTKLKRILTVRDAESYSHESVLDNIHEMVRNYFTIENMGIYKPTNKLLSNNDQRAINIMKQTTKQNGFRYEVGLLWKSDNFEFPESFTMALKRLEFVEKKILKDPELQAAYRGKIDEYLEKGYAYKVKLDPNNVESSKIWYLPHFGVRNPNKPGKFRLVFDAAAKSKGVSFNDMLLSGPDMNQTLLDVLFKFREARIGICSDIKEMFHRIDIRPEDQMCQRFLWRDGSPENQLEVYQMRAMIFGATCSPSLAQHVKNTNAMQFKDENPRAVTAITERHYVDDYVDSFETEEDAIDVVKQVVWIHQKGNFELANFVSNSERVLKELGVLDEVNRIVDVNVDVCDKRERILGMHWNTTKDAFVFSFQFHKVSLDILTGVRTPTKREMLSVIMSIFDPFGFLAHFVISAKILLQEVWKSGIPWDTVLPDRILNKWKLWVTELNDVQNITIPRCYSAFFKKGRVELHIFTDASENAYATVAYWRIISSDGEINVAFVAAKSRCSPIRPMSIPRLELQAAILGVRLKSSILAGHSRNADQVYYWSDSKTVIRWINSSSCRFKQFVEHRISEILEESEQTQWNWLPTTENIADEATRARFPVNLESSSRWFLGPNFLYLDTNNWPREKVDVSDVEIEEALEIRAPLFHATVISKLIDIHRFSNFSRLKRTVAWVFRFISNCKRISSMHHKSGELTPQEESAAEIYLSAEVQKDAYRDEYKCLKSQTCISKTSSLLSLNPIYDSRNDLIRADGRISTASFLPAAAQRPIILPKTHYFTELLVAYYHRKFHHQNQDLITCEIRRKFWIPSLKVLVRKTKSNCRTCKIINATPRQPLMAPLPRDRTTPYVSPFSYTGVDLFGPVHIKNRRNQEKRWVSVFTCMTTRAIHLEICHDQSTDAFLMSLRNFMNRRGVPVRIRSDCGSNFLGIDKELRNVPDFLDHEAMKSSLTPLGIEWIFNSPKYPNAGGCWERLIGSVKRVLRVVLTEQTPKLETLQSVLCEAENIVNSRPLTDIPVSIDEPEPITPNHFLMGKPNSTQTPGPYNWKHINMRKQWRIVQQLKNMFWKQWVRQYLPDLTRRAKWCQRSEPIKINDLVFVCEIDSPRSQWLRGKVTETYPGKDGVIRTVEVTTANKTKFRRPVSRLAVLDVEQHCSESK
ncbi:uncharacterized protein LOC129939152 [Eupeodes corollae]|uniref:uncharacterized protein LOC129939152 n=1 Tax=Eupeodes corollae TaxID=290404 RepID=UPI00249094F8|nr:uncharacterized protein LOC129939152 [Eupeodes corollae]